MRILIVEDEPALNESICDFLTSENHECFPVLNHFDAEDALLDSQFELIVLDINLPDGSGLDLLRWVKSKKMNTGVLIVSARDSLNDRIDGLDLGADDYLTKPFHLAELNARVKAILRRRLFDGSNSIVYNEIEIFPEDKRVTVHGELIKLTPKQFQILEYLISNRDKVISKESLVDYLWKDDLSQAQNLDFIYNHVKNIRVMIKSLGGEDYIRTIYGFGYRFGKK